MVPGTALPGAAQTLDEFGTAERLTGKDPGRNRQHRPRSMKGRPSYYQRPTEADLYSRSFFLRVRAEKYDKDPFDLLQTLYAKPTVSF